VSKQLAQSCYPVGMQPRTSRPECHPAKGLN